MSRIRDDASQIDILVVYTQAAGLQMSPSPDVFVDLAVGSANASFMLSGINTRLNLVTSPWAVDLNLPNLDQDFIALTANGEGYVDGLHDARDKWAADVVTLFTANNLAAHAVTDTAGNVLAHTVCGRSWTRTALRSQAENAALAFNVVSVDCSITRWSFAHEYGHVFGTTHDPFTLAITGEADSLGNVVGLKTAARGFVLPPVVKRSKFVNMSIMAIGAQCDLLGWNCLRVLRWSNAQDLVFGSPFGVPDGYAGAADNVQVLNVNLTGDHVLEDVANYRLSICRWNPNCVNPGP